MADMWAASELTLAIVAAVLLALLNLAAVMMVVMQLPGTWVMLVLTAAFALWRGGDVTPGIGLGTVIVLLILAIVGEVVETLAGAAGARKAGGTRTGAVLAVIGGIVGAIAGTAVLVVVGTILGACIGAGIGSIIGDVLRGRELAKASLAARGAMVGKFWGTLGKIAIATVMWFIATIALVWP